MQRPSLLELEGIFADLSFRADTILESSMSGLAASSVYVERLGFVESVRQLIQGNSLRDALVAGLVFFTAVFCLWSAKRLIGSRLERLSKRTSTQVDDLVSAIFNKTKFFFIVGISLFLAASFLQLTESFYSLVQNTVLLLFLFQVWFWGRELLEFVVSHLIEQDKDIGENDEAVRGTMPALMFLGKLFLFSVILLLALDNFGIDITALIASLGIGGIAIALAVQNILGDLFASLSIVLDKPFKVGDFIIVGEALGTVEKIGLKTTRVRSLGGEQLIFSNNDLLNSRIRNFKQMNERRIVFEFGVIYQTRPDQIREIPKIVEKIIRGLDLTRFDRAHFARYGDSSLDFEVVYFVLSSDFRVYMDIQQEINNQLFEEFKKRGVEFAYPTQTLYVEKQAS